MNGFVFDMDGVLLDSIHIWHEAEQQILDQAGIVLTKEQRDHLNALTLEEAGDWFHEEFGVFESGEQVARSVMEYMLAFYNTRAQAKPGAFDFVRAIHEAGLPLCVLSSSPQAFIQAGLGHTQLKQFFTDDLVISAEDSNMKKRSPETFHRVCKMLGTEPANTWLFDDSWYALATAHEVGLHCVGVFSSDGCGTHEELARYSELVADDFSTFNVRDFL